MKKTTKTLEKIIVLSVMTAATLHATNGDNLIGIGAKARGMGGAGIAVSHGAESALANPALITSVENTEISFGGTLFAPTITTTLNGAPGAPVPPQEAYESDANLNMIPEVSIATKLDDNWYIGIGMWGTAGMGVDYSKAKFAPLTQGQFGNFNMVTNLQLLQFGVPIAYKAGGLSIAVTPVLQYGNLDINYRMPTPTGSIANVGTGLAQDFGFGFNAGATYDFSQDGVAGLTVGVNYKSSIEMNYDGQLTTATGPFRLSLPAGDTLEQPEEYGVGIAYEMGEHTIAFDYRKVNWSSTKGYGDFGWEDGDVYAVGYQYTEDNWAVRVGYNHSSSVVVEGRDPRLNFFNLMGFPATAEDHYTVGGTYDVSKSFSVDLAYVYEPTATKTFSTAGLGLPFSTLTTDHKENSLSFQLNYTY
ncbi:MAG: aromatic hydrocarbon degradation protein [Sulfurovum sp.]|nr:MAG: aromatic hydrocarbon degradation protein [Sulfurovum sp.]